MAKTTLREALLAEYTSLPTTEAAGRGAAAKRFCRRWGGRVAGLYRHAKGGLYAASGLAIVEADLSVVVTYRAADGSPWVRPIENFFGDARPGVRRFRRVKRSGTP